MMHGGLATSLDRARMESARYVCQRSLLIAKHCSLCAASLPTLRSAALERLQTGSGRLRRTQTGFVRSYAMSMFGGAVLVVGALLLVRAG